MWETYKSNYSNIGRISRKNYLIFNVVQLALRIALGMVTAFLVSLTIGGVSATDIWTHRMDMSQVTSIMLIGKVPVALLVMVGYCLADFLLIGFPWIMTTVRRLHDHNLSGWYFLLYPAFGVILGAVLRLARQSDVRTFDSAILIVFILICAIAFFYLFLKRGTKGPNRFGPDQVEMDHHFKQRQREKRMGL